MSVRRSRSIRFVVAGAVVGAATVVAGPAASAAALTGTVSASAFASACAAGPVTLAPSAKVEGGAASVVGGCTVNVPFDGALEFVDTNLTFGGPVIVNGQDKSKWEIVNSTVTAPSVRANLTGFENQFKIDKGSVRATAGGVTVAMGQLGMVQIASAQPGSQSIRATGAVAISGGPVAIYELNNAVIQSGSFALNHTGTEAKILANTATITTSGSTSFNSNGPKGLLESSFSTFTSGGNLSVNFAGDESVVKAVSTTLASSAGAVSVSAATAGFGGLIELAGPGAVLRGRSVSLAASTATTATKGTLNLSLGTVTATAGAVSMRTGDLGSTLLKESSVNATTSVTVASAPTGVCLAELAIVTAPTRSICV